MKQFKRVVLLTDADKLHRLPSDLLDRQRRAASRIAIHFGEDEAIESELLMEFLRAFYGILTQHCIGNKQDFIRTDAFFDFLQFVHQSFVDMKAAGRVDDNNVMRRVPSFTKSILAEL